MKITNKPNERRMRVRITTTANWYKKCEVHEVGQYTTTDFIGEKPFYEMKSGFWGIDIEHCEIIEAVNISTSILSALGKGQKHGQTAKKLRTKLGLSLPRFMEQVHELRTQGHWICADNNGYYLAATTEEKQRLIKSLKSRVKSINEVINKLT